MKDQIHDRYLYDADNRIIDVFTSEDEVIWDHDAFYDYYLHGLQAHSAATYPPP